MEKSPFEIGIKGKGIIAYMLDVVGNKEGAKITHHQFKERHISLDSYSHKVGSSFGSLRMFRISNIIKRNGDSLYDPSILFLISDLRQKENDLRNIKVYASTYTEHMTGRNEESIFVNEDLMVESVNEKLQRIHTHLANHWLLSLQIDFNLPNIRSSE